MWFLNEKVKSQKRVVRVYTSEEEKKKQNKQKVMFKQINKAVENKG